MKDYIDLTQLPAEKVEAMVLALSKNDFDLLRKYCDELGILYGYPMEEVVNIFSDQLLLSKKTLTRAVGQMDPESLASRVGKIEETLPSKADLSALEPLQQRVSDISNENSEINGRLDKIENDISILSNGISTEISTVNEKINTISNKHDNLAESVGDVLSDLNTAIDKLNTIQEGAEKNTISAIQLNGKSIQLINKTVNLTNVVVNDDLKAVSATLSSSFNDNLKLLKADFDTNLKTLKAETDGATDALTQNVGNINNILDSKLDISVAKQISADLSSDISTLSASVNEKTIAFNSQFALTNAAVDVNKVRIGQLETKNDDILDTINNVSVELKGNIDGSITGLTQLLNGKVSNETYTQTLDTLNDKDDELSEHLEKQQHAIKNIEDEVKTHSKDISEKISAIYVTTTKSKLIPTDGVISIDVATTSIINAQISAMADVFHVTVDEFAEHFNEDLSVVSAAIDAKTDLSVFKPVAENVKQLTISASVNAANILNLSNDISSAVHHCDHLHSNAISLINCLSSSLDTERNYRETSDAKLDILISKERDERISAVEKERGERIEGDKELDRKIETLTEKLLREYAELQKTHTTDVSKLKETITDNYDALTKSISDEATTRNKEDQALSASIDKLEKTVIKCEAIVEQNKADYQQHASQIADLTAITASNTANIESLTTRLKDHTEAGSKRFDEIHGKLDELEVAINGDKSGGNGLADRINDAEKEIAGLTADLNTTKKQLSTLTDTSLSSIDKLNDTLYGNSSNEPGLVEVVDNLIDKVLGEDGLDKRLGSAEGNIVTLNATTENIDSKLEKLSDSIKNPESGLISQVNGNTESIVAIQKDVKQNSDDITSLNTAITENGGINDKIDDLSVKIWGEIGLNNVVQSIINAIGGEALDPATSATISQRLDKIEDTDVNTSTTIGGIQTNIADIQTNIEDLSETVKKINNDLSGNHDDNPDIFGVHDRIEDLERSVNTISGLSTDVDALQLSATAVVEKITSVSKDLDETRGWINDLSKTTNKINEAIYGDGNPLNGLDNIVADHGRRIEALENKDVDLSPIYVKLGEVENDISGLSAENESLLAAVESAQTNIDTLGDRIDDLERNKVDLSPINVRLDDLETENAQLLNAVTVVQESIETLNDKLDENIEAGISDIFAEAIGNLSDDSLVDDEYQIKEITTDGSTMKDVIDRLNAIITVINNVAK